MKTDMLPFFLILLISIAFSCTPASTNEKEPDISGEPAPQESATEGTIAPDWAKNAVIYEVNLRQYSKEGTLKAFTADLERLKKMNIDILWFMPVHPISKTKRKGTMGSYYAVSDYRAINPEYGTMEDFDAMVKKAHDMGMYVILDWVPNHTGWDHPWIKEHPDFYTKGKDGKITDPINEDGKPWGWTDVADLNYDNPDLRAAMTADLEFWVREHDIDGYRCDVAGAVPDDFWDAAVPALRKIKPVFMLAEAEHPPHRNSGNFAMNYGWEFHHIMNQIAKGEKNATDIDKYLKEYKDKYSRGYAMNFTTNHDENSWNGTVFERMGDGAKTFAVLASTLEGMPLLYSGQEAPLKKRLEFFEKDAINWNNYEYAPFYTTLFELKEKNKALWNGEHGAPVVKVPTENDTNVYAFTREKDGDKVFVILNLTKSPQKIHLHHKGTYTEVFSGESKTFTDHAQMELKPWQYLVYSNK